MKVIAIIPARGGSKGVPGKNRYPIQGKPLISYTIEAALGSKLLNKIIVSSDDPIIKKISGYFSKVRFHQRPDNIAGDSSPVSETIEDVLNLFDPSCEFDAVMLLQPTSPIRTAEQIDQAIELFTNQPDANSLISVCAMDDVHPARMYWKDNLELKPILTEFEQTRRQDIPKAYYRNGSIYITRIAEFKICKSVMIKPSIGFEMPTSHLLNIDEPRDILIAEVLIKEWKEGKL
jgi:CMP-N-acetylneuraminic acid synthetase